MDATLPDCGRGPRAPATPGPRSLAAEASPEDERDRIAPFLSSLGDAAPEDGGERREADRMSLADCIGTRTGEGADGCTGGSCGASTGLSSGSSGGSTNLGIGKGV